MNESETRAEYIDPKLKASGWGEASVPFKKGSDFVKQAHQYQTKKPPK